MGYFTALVAVFAVFMIAQSQAAGECPQPSKVYSCSPKCVQTYECTNGKVCCPNGCNTKSCVEAAAYSSGSSSNNKYASGGSGSYCNNVKCNSFEVCKLDPSTKKMKCMRA